jgi:hypothetical protein
MVRRSSGAVPIYSEYIKSSESTEVILCVDGDVTPEVVSSRTVGGFNHVYSPCYF